MATLNMNGPYKMDTNTIDAKVTRTSPGNYALGKKDNDGTFIVGYVGRSDTDVGNRLKSWIKNTTRPLFKFSYETSPKTAFENGDMVKKLHYKNFPIDKFLLRSIFIY